MRYLLIGIFGSIIAANLASGSTTAFINVSDPTYSIGAGEFEAIITTGAGTITVELENFLTNPTADTQEISGIQFLLNFADSATPAISTTTPPSGQLINIATSGGTWSNDTTDSISHWEALGAAGASTTTVTLDSFSGGKPADLVIGPPLANLYTAANSGVTGHLPSIQDVATFTINLANVTAATQVQVTGATFNIGTNGTQSNTVVAVLATPEPSSLLFVLLGLPVGLCLHKKRR